MVRCSKCIMTDKNDPDISFDEQGKCSYCSAYEERVPAIIKEKKDNLVRRIRQIKLLGKNQEFDAICGISGGPDSAFALHLAREYGLKVLSVHVDNHWNDPRATQNVLRLASPGNLYYYTLNKTAFFDLQRAYLKAGVVDIEVPTDHCFMGALYQIAEKFNIKTIITGQNLVTEAIMPRSWGWPKMDYENLISIWVHYGKMIKYKDRLPLLPSDEQERLRLMGFHTFDILNHIDYIPVKAINELEKIYDYHYIPGKHYESLWTKFYQCYILPYKFNIEKRLAHKSTQINAGFISRSTAMAVIEYGWRNHEKYYDIDIKKLMRKLGMKYEVFERLMNEPPKHHGEY